MLLSLHVPSPHYSQILNFISNHLSRLSGPIMQVLTPQNLVSMLFKILLFLLPFAPQTFASPFVRDPLKSDTIDSLCHPDTANWYAFKAPKPYTLNTTDCQLAQNSMIDYVHANFGSRNIVFRDKHLNPGRTNEEVLPKQFKGPAQQCVITLAMRSAISNLEMEFREAPPRQGADVLRVEGMYPELVDEAKKLIHDCQGVWAHHRGKAAGWKAGGEGGAIAVAIWDESSDMNRKEVFAAKTSEVVRPPPESTS